MIDDDQSLTSYLVQLNAYAEEGNSNRRRSVRGQITFAKPGVGVIMANRLLKELEIDFGLPGVESPGPRMIEARPAGDQLPGFATVILAAERLSSNCRRIQGISIRSACWWRRMREPRMNESYS